MQRIVPTPGYTWVVDHTWVADPDDDEATTLVEETDQSLSCNGVTGPYGAPDELLKRLAAGEGRRWRTLYDPDGPGHPEEQRLVHEGRYLDWHDLVPSVDGDLAFQDVDDPDSEFGPLDDLSRPDSGATEIQYLQEDGTWKAL